MDLCEGDGRRLPESERHFWELARADFLLSLAGRYLTRPEGMLLDIGCGDGFLLERFAAALPSWHFHAVDPAFDAGRIAELEALLPGRLAATAELPPELPGQVAAVTLFDVLEHIEDDGDFLRRLVAGAAPGAIFLITVPAGRRLFGPHDRALRHFRRYDRAGLTALLATAGLETLECRSFFSSLYWVRRCELRLRKEQGDGVGAGAISPRFLNGWLRRILAAEARGEGVAARCGLRLPGLSLEAVCRISR